MFRRFIERFKTLWRLAKTERALPHQVGWAVFVGVFAGCTPAVGVHGWVAVGLATVFRLNRLYAWLGSRISNILILPFIIVGEIQVAHRLRAGEWASITREDALTQGKTLLLDWILGSVPMGLALGAVFGAGAYFWARTRARISEVKEGP